MNRRQILTTTGAAASLGLCAGIVAGVPGCTPAPAAELVSADLAVAIERHRTALADMEASGRVQEACERAMHMLETPGTRSAFDAAEDAFDLDCEREQAAHNKVLAAPILTLADMRAKAAYLASVSRHMIHDGDTMAALLASMGASTDNLSAVSVISSEPDEMADIATEYIASNEWLNASDITDEADVASFCAARIDPLRDRITGDAPTPTTMAGALAAVRLAERSMGQGDDELAEPLIVAVRRFLERRA